MAIKIQKTGFSYGRRGDAKVKKTSDDLLLVKFLDDGEQFRVSFDEAHVPRPEKVNGVFRVALDDNLASLRFIAPVNDIVKGAFVGFTRNEEGNIVVKLIEEKTGVTDGRKWTIPEHVEFYARFYLPEVGIIVPYGIPLAFIDVNGEVGIAGFGSKKVINFLTATGIDFAKDTLRFGDEMLEDLEKILLERKQPVKLSFNNGYIKDLTAFQSFSTLQINEEEDEEEEVSAPKKEKAVEPKPKGKSNNISELLDLWEGN